MQHNNKILLIIFSISLGLSNLTAQEAIPCASGNASGSGGSGSYTIGEVFYSNYKGTNGNVNQGIQQPFDVQEITGISEAKGINISVNTFPNPVQSVLTLKVENYPLDNLTYDMYTIDGKLIESNAIEAAETTIEMSTFSSSSYFLKICNNHKEVKIFTIVKH